MTDTQHLLKRHRTWYVRVAVPRPLWAVVGRREILRSLQTSDLKEAQKRRWPAVAAIRSYISTFQSAEPDWLSPEGIIRFAQRLGAEVQMGDSTPAMAGEAMDQRAWEIAQRTVPGTLDLSGAVGEALEKGLRLVDGKTAPGRFLSDVLERHLANVKGAMTATGVAARRRACEELITHLGDVPIADVSKRQASEYVTGVVLPMRSAPKTKVGRISALSSLWAWAITAGYAEGNVFAGLSALVKVSKRGVEREDARRAWTDGELGTVLAALPASDYLLRLLRVLAYSGLRLEEACQLRGSDIEAGCFVVRAGKTQAALRRVPVHPELAPLVEGIKMSDFVIPSLVPGGPDARRGHPVSKRWNRYRSQWGASAELTLHGLRRSFAQKLEGAGVALSTAELLLGHARSSMSFGTYSRGVPVEVLRQAVENVYYELISDS